MTHQPTTIADDLNSLPKLPAWVTSGRAETPETVAFRSGAALTVLDQLVSDPSQGVPLKLLANRLALSAATATSQLEGRLAREADIRDAYHLTPPGEARGPDGDLLAFWRDVARLRMGRTVGTADLIGPDFLGGVEGWLHEAQSRSLTHGPLAGCTSAMRAVLEADDQAERVARSAAPPRVCRIYNPDSGRPRDQERGAAGRGTKVARQGIAGGGGPVPV